MLTYYLDVGINRVVSAAGSTIDAATKSVRFDPTGGTVPVALYLSSSGTVVETSGLTINFQARPTTTTQNFDDAATLSLTSSDWTLTGVTGSRYYAANLTPDSAGLRTLLGYDPNTLTTADVASVTLKAGFSVVGYGESEPFDLVCHNAVVRTGSPATPSSDPRLLGPKTALTGGGALALDGIVTTTLPVTVTLAQCVVSAIPSLWQLVAGTTAESTAGGIVRPDDYHGTTNAKIWSRIL